MLEVGNALLAKDPKNLGMLLLVSDYYGEKGEQLDKAESYARQAATLAESAARPENVSEDQWKQQTALQKRFGVQHPRPGEHAEKEQRSGDSEFPGCRAAPQIQ